jgi:hypothetical protein
MSRRLTIIQGLPTRQETGSVTRLPMLMLAVTLTSATL